MKLKFSLIFFAILLSLQLNAQDSWQQFRGNNRNGASTDIRINEKSLDTGQSMVWKKTIGSGYTEILASNNKVFTMISEKTDSIKGSEFLAAYDAISGEEVWKTPVDSMVIDSDGAGEPPRSTPAIDDKAIYCLSSHGKLRALSLEDGEILWTVNFMEEYDNKPGWIYTTSPILYNNELIIEVGATESRGFASFDKKTGKALWINGVGKSSYCSPTIATIDGEMNTIFANSSTLVSFDKTGNELWSIALSATPTATPLFIAPNKVFVSSARGCALIKIENNEATEVFSSSSMRNTFSNSCYYNGHIYGISANALKCISATDGESKWKEKGFGLGNITLVGNKLIALTDKGILKIVEAVPEEFTEKASFQAIGGDNKSYTAPSYADGKVYLRNLSEMASYKLD
jgi:outer membrane protein assembly factor BamB